MIEEFRIPKGLSLKRLPLNLPDIPPEIKIRWEDTHLEFSRSLMKVLLSYWSNRTQQLTTETNQLREGLLEKCDDNESELIGHLLTLASTQEQLKLLDKNGKAIPL